MSWAVVHQGGSDRVAITPRVDLHRLLVDRLADGLLACDESGRLIAVNPAARRILGEVVNRAWPEDAESLLILHRDQMTRCPLHEIPLYRALRGEPAAEQELCVHAAEASEGIWITASGSALRDDAGAICGAMMTFGEISRRKRIEAALGEDKQRLEHQYRRQAALAQVELAISEPQELEALLERIVRIAQDLTPSSFSIIVLLDPRSGSLQVSASTIPGQLSAATAPRVRRGGGATRWILDHGSPLTVSNVKEDPFGANPMLQEFGIQAYAGVPLIGDGRASGVLYALDLVPREYSQDDLDFMAALANRAASSIAKVRLYERLSALNESLRRRTVAVRENERRFRTLADTAPVLIWMARPDLRCTYVNKPWLEFTGRRLDHELGYGWLQGVHREDLASLRAAFATGASFRREFRLRRHDGRYRWMLATGTPRLGGEGGELLGYTGCCIDITERREAEAELTRHREQLESLVMERTAALRESNERLRVADRLAAIGTLTAGLGHDMNNVLFPLRCRLDALDLGAAPVPLRGLLHSISQSVEYLQHLTDALRLFALDPDGADVSSGRTRLHSWWNQIQPLMASVLPPGVTLRADLARALPPVLIAPHALTQAILNLVVNAAEAMPDGGEVRITAALAPDPEAVRLSVSDQGTGMDGETLRRAFDPFFTTKKRRLSTGLGLSLVHSVVTSAQGTINIESNPGRGTSVAFTLPIDAEADSLNEPDEDSCGACATVSLRDERQAAWISGLLRSGGYQVRRASNGDPGPCRIWITDAMPENLKTAQRFLASQPDARVVAMGATDDTWPVIGATVVSDTHRFQSIREAVAEAMRSEGGPDG